MCHFLTILLINFCAYCSSSSVLNTSSREGLFMLLVIIFKHDHFLFTSSTSLMSSVESKTSLSESRL